MSDEPRSDIYVLTHQRTGEHYLSKADLVRWLRSLALIPPDKSGVHAGTCLELAKRVEELP